MGWFALNCTCCPFLGAHAKRIYTRKPGTNDFECDGHAAVVKSAQAMAIDGVEYSWSAFQWGSY